MHVETCLWLSSLAVLTSGRSAKTEEQCEYVNCSSHSHRGSEYCPVPITKHEHNVIDRRCKTHLNDMGTCWAYFDSCYTTELCVQDDCETKPVKAEYYCPMLGGRRITKVRSGDYGWYGYEQDNRVWNGYKWLITSCSSTFYVCFGHGNLDSIIIQCVGLSVFVSVCLYIGAGSGSFTTPGQTGGHVGTDSVDVQIEEKKTLEFVNSVTWTSSLRLFNNARRYCGSLVVIVMRADGECLNDGWKSAADYDVIPNNTDVTSMISHALKQEMTCAESLCRHANYINRITYDKLSSCLLGKIVHSTERIFVLIQILVDNGLYAN
ncbi:hypothetical protein ScPMuIL_013266 [Solemya velum]